MPRLICCCRDLPEILKFARVAARSPARAACFYGPVGATSAAVEGDVMFDMGLVSEEQAMMEAAFASLAFVSLGAESWSGGLGPARIDAAAGPRTDLPEPISPLLAVNGLDAELVELGALLFSDQRLSVGAGRSCASCHRLDGGGDDGRRRGIGVTGEELLFNVPSIFNAGKNYRFNWRGNFETLEEQNDAILLDPKVMGASWPAIVSALGEVATMSSASGLSSARRPAGEAFWRRWAPSNAP